MEFDKICSFENLRLAYLKARKCKRYRNEVLKFSYNLEERVLKLQEELLNQNYQHGGYREFIVCDAKKRQIKAAPFRDRVVHHAVCNIIEPIFDKGFIYDSYACRKEKGTHKAMKRLEQFLKSVSECAKGTPASPERVVHARDGGQGVLNERKIYCLKCDISKYFASINHKVLLELIKKKITDIKVIWLIQEILNSNYEREVGVGIPIGNVISQLFANIYLNELDQFVKHTLRVKHYIRYMDDFLILDHNKTRLHQTKKVIQEFLQNKLKLELHPKKANVSPIEKGVDFLGYQIFVFDSTGRSPNLRFGKIGDESRVGTYRLLRKSTVKRFIKRTKVYKQKLIEGKRAQERLDNSLQSWLAHAKLGESYGLRKDLSEKLGIKLVK